MTYAANADDRPQSGPWAHGPWGGDPDRYAPPRMHPGWIVLMVLGFVFWWPLGLAMLALILWSRNMGCCSPARWQHKMQRMEEKMERWRDKMERFGHGWGAPPSSGNRAFDEYRTETLRRLEDEEREFREFLHRLRAAKDKAEFDQFMADRRGHSGPSPTPTP